MSSEKHLEQTFMPTFCFGDITRDEINTVLNIAGVSLSPPTKTPFVTGIQQRRKPVIINTPIIIEPAIKYETILVERLPEDNDLQVKQPTTAIPPPTPVNSTPTAKPTSTTTTETAATTATTATTNGVENVATPTSSSATTTTTVTPTEPPSPKPKAKPPVSSWASLLKKGDAVKKPVSATQSPLATNGVTTNGKTQAAKPSKPVSPTPSIVPKFTGVADIINKYEPNYNAPLILPRGLINNVNTCFMNVILQPLSHCAPFYNLIKSISNQSSHNIKSKTPLLDSIVEFINEFPNDRLDSTNPYGEAFVPEYVYNALRGQKKFDTLRGRQEDSEEFLCYLLDGLHEEMIDVLKEQYEKTAVSSDEDGAKNKKSNVFDESPISKTFSGKVRSVLRCPGAKDSINMEPYQSLPLDIQPNNVHSIEDAIQNMTLPEIMHDYTSPKGIKVDATKQVYLEILPPVLILHMKRFVFDNVGGVQKLLKQVNYGAKLTIDPEWMAPASRLAEPITYKLFGSVYHHGTSAGGGHYTCDIKRRNGEWLHIDDTNITSVSEQDVLVTDDNTRTSEKIHAGQTAYILFYVKSS